MTTTDDARAVAREFGLPDDVSVCIFGAGHIHHTFLAEMTGGDVVLQRLNTNVFRDPDQMMTNVLAVCRHTGGALVPEPIRAASGRWLVRHGSGVWRAWRRVTGSPATEVTPVIAEAAGGLLGRFHVLIGDLEPDGLSETLPAFHDPARRLQALRAAVAADPHARARGARDEIERALGASALADIARDVTAAVPLRVAHYDAKLDNLLFLGDRAVCVIDLDTVMPGRWFWDIGDLVRTAATSQEEDDPNAVMDLDLYAAVVGGYRATVGTVATSAELDAVAHAGAIVTFEQSLRFLTDWLEGDVYYRTTRVDQNLDRARAQLNLLASMPGTVTFS